MKEKLTNNLALKLLSLALAAFLWMVVVNLDDPVTSVQFLMYQLRFCIRKL